ncbi:inactive glucose-1-phosphate adenylyltransferase small subunit 2, chloroplastic isoform X2 [Macadamia integrifolia]|uniref:inactive glucose-1-phosphate adenylyltransferase small subunit 2, chloroplastic isoform X2 n=1 Tax=Macadamia integrifolia TaxID=60698 RepID=UPI001C528150|nr:inactive glucose-1-phosphate adenylyltransferase small subunit 2, chloroplastic isoform X2 [Macadamia integrifolia]
MLQVQIPTPVTLTAKLPILRLVRSCDNHPPLRLPSSAPLSLFISNSQKPENPNVFPPLNQSVAAIVFGDGSESRLYPLTRRRSGGAVPIAANYRLIDVVVSNCINSNISKIYALTQFNSTSLNSHLFRAYSGKVLGKEGFVEVIAAYQSPEGQGWFQGTADAIRRCLWVLEDYPVLEFLVLPGHHLYRMDYQKLIEAHRNNNADITISVSCAVGNRDPGFGFLKVNSKNQVLEFRERPDREPLKSITIQEEGSKKSSYGAYHYFSSMGIYVIKRDIMTKLLTESFPNANEITNEIIPGAISMGMKVQSYTFDGYWEDMRSIEAFYQANMDVTKRSTLGFNFYDKNSPLYTLPRCLPPTLVTDADVIDSVIGDGCILKRCKVKGSVVGMRTRIEDGAVIEDSVLMGSDIYQEDCIQRCKMDGKRDKNPIGIGKDSYIRKAIVDKNARIGKNVQIVNKGNVQEGNRESDGFVISGGIVIVLKSAVIPDCSII